MIESVIIRAWLHDAFDGIGTGAYHGVAPADAVYPYIVYQMLSAGNDVTTMNLSRVWSDPLYLIKAVCEGESSGPIEELAGDIDTALHGASGTVTGGVVVKCRRERPHDLPQYLDGVMYQNLGGEYRFQVREA